MSQTATWIVRVGAVLALAVVLRADGEAPIQDDPLAVALERSVTFLSAEVPKWRIEQGCFSCHNNGDAARALIQASVAGFDVTAALADTLAFLSRPDRWEENSTGGAFDDKALARVQFAVLRALHELDGRKSGEGIVVRCHS